MNTTPKAPETEDDIERRAKRRVEMKMGFYIHALVFVCVNGGLWVLQLSGHNSPFGRLHGFPLWGWGLGLAIHGLVTFISLRGEGLRERMLRDEIERLKAGR